MSKFSYKKLINIEIKNIELIEKAKVNKNTFYKKGENIITNKVDTSLKFDIQIIGMPTTIISIDCK